MRCECGNEWKKKREEGQQKRERVGTVSQYLRWIGEYDGDEYVTNIMNIEI